jgi:hypothetical protein
MMGGNYEWQKFRANERVQARLKDAVVHRMVKEGGGNGRSPFLNLVISKTKTTLSVLKSWLHKNRSRTVKRERLV